MYLRHILDAISDIYTYTRGLTQKEFLSDKKTQDAVIRKMEIIGEASNQLTLSIRKMVPGVPWRDIVDMRNKLTHEYFAIDLTIIWGTAKKDLPIFEAALWELLESLT